METEKIHLLTSDQEPIISLCTPRGNGAIALLRISGQYSVEVIKKISTLSSGKKLTELPTHTIHHGYVTHLEQPEKTVDEVLFFLMRAPKTFTGQDTVEISCHNNQFIIQQIIDQAILAGARLAEHGEFTRRAFLNNKIDLVQAESINELIHAQTELALRKSMSQLHRSLSHFLHDIEVDLFGLLSLVEGSFEFFEEEQQDLDIDSMIKNRVSDLLTKLHNLKDDFNLQQQIKDGIKICMLGWVNVGKSTLFNALLKKDRAIVTKIEGTTRDSIQASLYKNGNFWSLIDTAGLRQTGDFIEQQGIERSWKQASRADIILFVCDISKDFTDQQIQTYKKIVEKYNDKIIFVANKIDLQDEKALKQFDFIVAGEVVKVSGMKKIGVDLLESMIENKIQKLFSKLQSPFLLNQRQHSLITQLCKNLEFIAKDCADRLECELIAYHLKGMLEQLSELTGKNVTEKVLDRVFRDFCIGK